MSVEIISTRGLGQDDANQKPVTAKPDEGESPRAK